MWEWIPAALTFASSMFGSHSARQGQEGANQMNWQISQDQMNWSAGQAEKQMAFQKSMSDTSHQRGVADLQAAGLNPMLSAMHGGASSPPGAMGGIPHVAEMRSAKGAGEASRVAAATAAAQVVKAISEAKLADKEAEKVSTETDILRPNVADAPEVRHLDVVRRRVENHLLSMEENLKRSMYDYRLHGRANVSGDVQRALAELEHLRAEAKHARSGSALQDVEARLKRLDIARGEAYSGMYKSQYGKDVAPYLHSASEGLRSIGSGAIGYRLLRR